MVDQVTSPGYFESNFLLSNAPYHGTPAEFSPGLAKSAHNHHHPPTSGDFGHHPPASGEFLSADSLQGGGVETLVPNGGLPANKYHVIQKFLPDATIGIHRHIVDTDDHAFASGECGCRGRDCGHHRSPTNLAYY